MLTNKNGPSLGKVLTFNPKENKVTFVDYTEKSIHKKHGKMYEITTRRGYKIKLTDDHSLATNGDENFFKPLKPSESIGKFVPILYRIHYDVTKEDALKHLLDLKKSQEKVTPDLLFVDRDFLSKYILDTFEHKNASPLYSFQCLTKEEETILLLALARLGIPISKIENNNVVFDINDEQVLPNMGKLEKISNILTKNPANPYLKLEDFTWDEVTSVVEIPREEITYDFSVPEFPLFIANGILVYDTINY